MAQQPYNDSLFDDSLFDFLKSPVEDSLNDRPNEAPMLPTIARYLTDMPPNHSNDDDYEEDDFDNDRLILRTIQCDTNTNATANANANANASAIAHPLVINRSNTNTPSLPQSGNFEVNIRAPWVMDEEEMPIPSPLLANFGRFQLLDSSLPTTPPIFDEMEFFATPPPFFDPFQFHRMENDALAMNIDVPSGGGDVGGTLECPICFDKYRQLFQLSNCNHKVCDNCFNAYVKVDLKNIEKYPLKCFIPDCEQLLHDQDVFKTITLAVDRKMYERFSVLCAMPQSQRDSCPDCDMVYFVDDAMADITLSTINDRLEQSNFQWIDDSVRGCCRECNTEFWSVTKLFNSRKHHCRVCGEIFCSDCADFEIPLIGAELPIIAQFIRYTVDSNNGSRDKIKSSLNEEKSEAFDYTQLSQTRDWNDFVNTTLRTDTVRSCVQCWLRYYRSACPECGFEYCGNCRRKYHRNDPKLCDKNSLKNQKIDRHQQKLTQQFIEKQDWRPCPGCQMMIAKTSGCNHMEHKNCAHPNENTSTHFCYCCGEKLYQSSHTYEKNGKSHFPSGVFHPCRKPRKKKTFSIFGNSDNTNNEIDEWWRENDNNNNNSNCVVM